jgi:transposase
MRGSDEQNGALFSYVNLEDRVPRRHPLRVIRQIVNAALARLDARFAELYAAEGRPSIPPERLLRAVLIQILFSIRSERQLMEQMQYNLLFRWFVGLGIDDPVWVPTVFTKNRDRLLTTDIRPPIARRHPGGRGGQAVAVGRAFLGGRHADPGLGLNEKLPAQGGSGRWRATGRR